ncbi:conserved hypothetical protein [Rhizobium mesoamericanum STM3625]|uniref:Uncharacterized protein n=1 Tax=Rhizobium mesoamericanum STM3625 TaxID=1211777 RepID=K0Q1P7_9HYPH|nr:conserved hypothetical protein [Rhizobium mesoamericanum STM3625]
MTSIQNEPVLPGDPTSPPMPPPFKPDPPIKEPDPDRLPDEVPLPNPDENNSPPKVAIRVWEPSDAQKILGQGSTIDRVDPVASVRHRNYENRDVNERLHLIW